MGVVPKLWSQSCGANVPNLPEINSAMLMHRDAHYGSLISQQGQCIVRVSP